MGYRELTVEGLSVVFRNVPGSAITRVSIAGKDVFGFDPDLAAFVDFIDGHRVNAALDLKPEQVRALRTALMQHCELRARTKCRRVEVQRW